METIFGDSATVGGDFVLINVFMLEGWSLSDVSLLLPMLSNILPPHRLSDNLNKSFHFFISNYKRLQQISLVGKIIGSWKKDELNLSPWPFTDPVTELLSVLIVGLQTLGFVGFDFSPPNGNFHEGVAKTTLILEVNYIQFIQVYVLAAKVDSSFSEQKIHRDGGIAPFDG
ncbi:hypothetical protein Cgig2_025318 [Carnegiea gigantea]|uniref:Uncharacterized protein n=1 Tax=Carnegiea gigantea TaxID=171969 RepID=A0A9Q1K0E7_9CARY|nr:hypothetical protein Cgig2_025318 [Carnegiea gigantea]